MSTKTLDNSNPTVHATLTKSHAEKPASQSALLASLWKTSNEDGVEQGNDMKWIRQVASEKDYYDVPSRSNDAEREEIDELEVFGEQGSHSFTLSSCLRGTTPRFAPVDHRSGASPDPGATRGRFPITDTRLEQKGQRACPGRVHSNNVSTDQTEASPSGRTHR